MVELGSKLRLELELEREVDEQKFIGMESADIDARLELPSDMEGTSSLYLDCAMADL